jgi:hypothetical protein
MVEVTFNSKVVESGWEMAVGLGVLIIDAALT